MSELEKILIRFAQRVGDDWGYMVPSDRRVTKESVDACIKEINDYNIKCSSSDARIKEQLKYIRDLSIEEAREFMKSLNIWDEAGNLREEWK